MDLTMVAGDSSISEASPEAEMHCSEPGNLLVAVWVQSIVCQPHFLLQVVNAMRQCPLALGVSCLGSFGAGWQLTWR